MLNELFEPEWPQLTNRQRDNGLMNCLSSTVSFCTLSIALSQRRQMNTLAPKLLTATGNILTSYIRHPVWFLWQRMEDKGSEELVGCMGGEEEEE